MILYSMACRKAHTKRQFRLKLPFIITFLMFFTILLYAIMPSWHVDAPSHILPSAYSVYCADKSVS